jgi:hypothetical protein
MKTKIISATIALPLVFALASCRKEATTETTVEKVSAGAEKAAEGVKDMADSATGALEKAAEGTKDAAAEATAEVKEAAAEATETIEETLEKAKEAAEEVEETPPTLPE